MALTQGYVVLTSEKLPEYLNFGPLDVFPGRYEVLVQGEPVNLTLTEFRVLLLFLQRPGWVFSRQDIVKSVNGEGYKVTDRAVDVQIVGLRKKLAEAGALIETVRGIGYRIKDLSQEKQQASWPAGKS